MLCARYVLFAAAAAYYNSRYIPEEHRKPPVIILAGLFAGGAVLFLLFILVGQFTKPKASSSGVPSAGQVSGQGSGAPGTPANSKDLVVTVTRDSVLRSTDGGEEFETFFTVATSGKIGTADVLSVTFHPLVKDRVIVTTSQDGLFINNGRENKREAIFFPPKKIYSFVLDKGSPDNRIFAAGVVDENGRVFRTNDGGLKWKAVYAEPGQNTYVTALAQHPKNTK